VAAAAGQKEPVVIDPKNVYSKARRGFQPLVRKLAAAGVTPNMLTMAGILLNLGAAALIVMGYLFWAGIVLIVASICDLLDGSVARYAGKTSRFGAFFDSTMDRISEGVVLAALVVYYYRQEDLPLLVTVLVFLLASFLVSYTRARAEALGLDCRIGIMSRAERLVLLITGLILARWYVLTVVLYAMAVLTAFTVAQRVIYVYRKTRSETAPPSGDSSPPAADAEAVAAGDPPPPPSDAGHQAIADPPPPPGA
jgi:CDP-diacylglycerol--glycerol-3-phosphate 3-phosphatidyltransferase